MGVVTIDTMVPLTVATCEVPMAHHSSVRAVLVVAPLRTVALCAKLYSFGHWKSGPVCEP